MKLARAGVYLWSWAGVAAIAAAVLAWVMWGPTDNGPDGLCDGPDGTRITCNYDIRAYDNMPDEGDREEPWYK